jgi:hypothetical protein
VKKDGEVRLTRYQAGKVWDVMFATQWPTIHPGHPLSSLMAKLVGAGFGSPEVRDFLVTGKIDPTVGMPSSPRYQQAAEAAPVNPQPDYEQSERMHRLAAHTAPQPGGGVVAGSF